MILDNLPQSSIRVDISYYNEAERTKLSGYLSYPQIEKLVGAAIEVPTAEFLAYYLFHRKRLGSDGFKDRAAIGRKLNIALAQLDGCITFSGHSICTAAGVRHQLTEVSEHIGEAIGLAAVSRIHGLIEADWAPIPHQSGRHAKPSFDFEITASEAANDIEEGDRERTLGGFAPTTTDRTSSDGEALIQVENKGSSNDDNRLKSANVEAQKRNIDKKKAKLISGVSGAKSDPVAKTIRYGTITVVDSRTDGNVRCWLTDPPGDEVSVAPRRHKLLQRLNFLRELISFVSPRSQLASALATRVVDVAAIENPFELDGVPLVRGDGEPFFVDSDFASFAFWLNKSTIEGEVAGVVVQINSSALMLIGIRRELVQLSVEQSFEKILEYRYKPITKPDSPVKCVFSNSRFRSLELPTSLVTQKSRQSGYSSFELPANAHYSASGMVFAIIPLPEE